MRRFLSVLTLLLVCGSPFAADQSFEKQSAKMLQHFVDGEVEQGIKVFSDDPLIRKNLTLVRIDEIVKNHAAWLEEVGPIVSFSRFFVRCYSDRLCAEIYIANSEDRPLIYRYTWFKPQSTWLLEGFSFTATLGPTLLDPEQTLWGSSPPAPAESQPPSGP